MRNLNDIAKTPKQILDLFKSNVKEGALLRVGNAMLYWEYREANVEVLVKVSPKGSKELYPTDKRFSALWSNTLKAIKNQINNFEKGIVQFNNGVESFVWSPTAEVIKTTAKGRKYVDTWDKYETEREALNENNDCAVRAVASATGKSYKETHATFRSFGRRSGRGSSLKMIGNSLTKLHTKEVEINSPNCTVNQFVRQAKKGTFVLIVRRHAFALIDGVIYGNWEADADSVRKRVRYAFYL